MTSLYNSIWFLQLLNAILLGGLIVCGLTHLWQRFFSKPQALRFENEKMINFILNSSPFLLAYWDTNLINKFANTAYARWFSIAKNNISGMMIKQVIGEGLYAQNLPFIEKALQGQPQEFIREIMNPQTGEIILTQFNYIPHFDVNNRVLGFYVMGIDISANANLAEYQYQYEAIFDRINKGVIITDPDRHITYVNQAFIEISGYNKNDIKGKSPNVLQGADTDANDALLIRKALGDLKPIQIEILNYRKDGRPYWVDITISPIFDSNGELSMFVGFQSDITARKKQEQQMIFMRSIVDNSPDLISMANLEGQITYMNQAGLDMLGIGGIKNIQNLQVKNFHSVEEYERICDIGVKTAIADGIWQGEASVLHHNGYEIPCYQIIQSHIDNKSAKYSFISTIIRDMTKIKENEKQLILSRQKAEHLAETKTEFLRNMSHEIRTPMNAILGFSDLALRHKLSPKSEEYFSKIKSASQGMLNILNDILEFSKLEAHAIHIKLSPFNLHKLQTHLLMLFTDLNERKGNSFNVNIAADVPVHVFGDYIRIEQVLINLLANATKFTHTGAVKLDITLVSLDELETTLQFSVTDTGIGISDLDQSKILKPFVQADSGVSRRFGGTGLGLSICVQLLDLMKSELKISSVMGQGSRFYFELPLRLSTAEETTEYKDDFDFSNYSQETINRYLKNIKILVAEDNMFNQQVIKELLKLSNINMTIVNNGAEAVQALKKDRFDMILMDLNMPVMDGFTATKLIKDQVEFEKLPIIGLSAAVTKEEQEQCFTVGMLDFVEKPIVPTKLINTICRHIIPLDVITELKTDKNETAPQEGHNSENTASHEIEILGLDISYLKEIVGADPDIIKTYLQLFVDTSTEISVAIIETIKAEQCLDASKAGHKLKSSAQTIGALKLGELCYQIEVAGKADDLATLQQLLPAFEEEWTEVIKHIQNYASV